jgi:hypothetical protein
MYKIIGADGKEYGPISTDILTKWLAEGRINAQTKVLPEGATEWKTLGEIPELAAAQPAAPAPIPPMGGFSTGVTPAKDQVNAPGICLIVTGAVYVLLAAVRFVGTAFMGAIAASNSNSGNPEFNRIMALSGGVNVALAVLCLLFGVLVILGGIRMRQLRNYGLCMTAAIVSMIPCTVPCCIVGLGIGIWAIVVLSKAEVKAAFTA